MITIMPQKYEQNKKKTNLKTIKQKKMTKLKQLTAKQLRICDGISFSFFQFSCLNVNNIHSRNNLCLC